MHEIAKKAREIIAESHSKQEAVFKERTAREAAEKRKRKTRNLNGFLESFGFAAANAEEIEVEENAILKGSEYEKPFSACELEKRCPNCGNSIIRNINNLQELGHALEEQFAPFHQEGLCKPVVNEGGSIPVETEKPKSRAELFVEVLREIILNPLD